MAQVYVRYDPYCMETIIKINGQELPSDSKLYQSVKKKRLRDWAAAFPELLERECEAEQYEIQFHGTESDWDDFTEAFHSAEKEETLSKEKLRFVETKFNDNIVQNVVDYFASARGNIPDGCKNTELIKAIENIRNPICSIYVTGAAGSGKSTLINALLRNRIMPYKNTGCTTVMTELFNEKIPCFKAVVYNEANEILKETDTVTYDMMQTFNDDLDISRIAMKGNIPFFRLENIILRLVDTPNSYLVRDQSYQNTVIDAIQNDSNSLILYVFDSMRLYEDTEVLHCIADQMKKGGKQVRSRFLFVMNKMDACNPEEEDVGDTVILARKFLSSVGIKDPWIFPCSAFTAFNIRTKLKNVEIGNLTRDKERQLRDTIVMIDKLNGYESMHLEQYVQLPVTAQRELASGLQQAKQQEDAKMQAMIHSGIHSIEFYITSCIKKYREMNTKNLIEAFHVCYQSFIETRPYKILVTATMSAGKSTFINALVGKNICLSRNMACTSKLHSIVSKPFDTDFTFDHDYALSLAANKEKEPEISNKIVVRAVYYDGILAGQRLIINDSPGVNFSGDAEHKQITDKMVSTGNYQLMVYLMNATQLGTNDDDAHLAFVKEHIGEKPILFVMNKVDAFNEEEEDIEEIASKQIKYLESKGFPEPLVCPVSARAGYLAKKAGNEEPGRMERRELNNMEDKFEQMDLAGYYAKHYPDIVIPDSEDADKQLLKNCGISYIETIIKTFCEGGCENGTSIR